MTRPLFTPEELAELAAYGAEMDESELTMEEIRESRERDREAKLDYLDHHGRRIAEQQRAYYQDPQRREAHNAWMREYNRKKREAQREKAHEAEARV